MPARTYLAVDLGASGGRVIAGHFDGTRLDLDEVHRFRNGPVVVAGHTYWDLLGLWNQVTAGLAAAGARYGESIASVGVDTWGVDFGLLGCGGQLLGHPFHYRDRRTQGMLERAFPIVSRQKIFAETGLQFLEINTLFQLLSIKFGSAPLLELAEHLLLMPDLFHWLLTGEKTNERTNASTTQIYNPTSRDWSRLLVEKFDFPECLFGELADPGANLGPLRRQVAQETGLRGVETILPGTHDTASAVLAVPVADKAQMNPDWCYLSSGTWSLMGLEVPNPVIDERCARLTLTNECGVGNTIRLLKNITGLWLLQECRRTWQLEGRPYDWEKLTQLAISAPAFTSFVNPDSPQFSAPQQMPLAIREACRATGQAIPQTDGAVVRCVLESLALKHRQVLGWLEEITGREIQNIYAIGGGTRNRLLCQMTADACNRQVIAGPVEATATGNVLMQALALGDLGSISELRDVVRRSFEVTEYQPQHSAPWNEAFEKFVLLSPLSPEVP